MIAPDGDVPSHWACYRFLAKLREHKPLLTDCIVSVVEALKRAKRENFSDPDASWGHRSAVSTRKGGGFYGYRLHMAVCSKTDLPLAWTVETAKKQETLTVAPLLDKLKAHGINPETCAMDKGYDNSAGSAARHTAAPNPGRQARRP
ncbi:MAG: transposase [Solirubrobacteraceae bacterium]